MQARLLQKVCFEMTLASGPQTQVLVCDRASCFALAGFQQNSVAHLNNILSQAASMQEEQASNYQSLLSYYKQKVDSLEAERCAWLAKLEECSLKMARKQQKQEQLRDFRHERNDVASNIVHHSLAHLDEQISSLSMERQNQGLQFQEAEQIIKMQELALQFPAIYDKFIPCLSLKGGQAIQNDLNLHSDEVADKNKNNKKKSQPLQKGFADKNAQSEQKQNKTKKNLQQILKMHLIETKKANETQICLMEQQEQLLLDNIRKIRDKGTQISEKQRGIIGQFDQKYNNLSKEHNLLAEKFFTLKRQAKLKSNTSAKESESLKKTYSNLQEKINSALKVYEKQNKAKQALILRKSQDFQEDYKAKMRAKQRNLQSLRENYEKMQQLCIERARKLQATVEKAKYQLQDVEERRRFLVDDLRQKLHELEKRLNEQRIQKARIDVRLKQKMLEEKEREEVEKQKEQQARRTRQKQQLIKTAYKKTAIPKSSSKKYKELSNEKAKKTQKEGRKQNKGSNVNNAEQSEEDSLQMSDIANIHKQIKELERKIERQELDD